MATPVRPKRAANLNDFEEGDSPSLIKKGPTNYIITKGNNRLLINRILIPYNKEGFINIYNIF